MRFGFDEVGRGCLAGPVTTCAVLLDGNLPIYTYKFLKKWSGESSREKDVKGTVSIENDTGFFEFENKDEVKNVVDFNRQKNIFKQYPKWWQDIYDSKKVNLKNRLLLERELLNTVKDGKLKFLILNCPPNLIDEFGISLCIVSMLAISVFVFKEADEFYCDGGINTKQKLSQDLLKKLVKYNNLDSLGGNFKIEEVLRYASEPVELFKKVEFKNKSDEKYLPVACASILAKATRDKYMEDLGKDFLVYDWVKNVGYGTKKHKEAILKYGVTVHHRQTWIH